MKTDKKLMGHLDITVAINLPEMAEKLCRDMLRGAGIPASFEAKTHWKKQYKLI